MCFVASRSAEGGERYSGRANSAFVDGVSRVGGQEAGCFGCENDVKSDAVFRGLACAI